MLHPSIRMVAADGLDRQGAPRPLDGGSMPPARRLQHEAGESLDEESFERFYQRTAKPLWAYLKRVSGRADLADDLLQEAFLRFLNRPAGVPRLDDGVAYLYRIATNLLRDRWRRQQREQGWLRELLSRDRWLVARDAQQRVDLERGLAQLAPRDRALLWLAYVDGYAHREIAEILAVEPGSVRVMLFRAKKKLASRLVPEKQKEQEG